MIHKKNIISYNQEKNHHSSLIHSICQINISWVCMISKHGLKFSTYNMYKFKNRREEERNSKVQRFQQSHKQMKD